MAIQSSNSETGAPLRIDFGDLDIEEPCFSAHGILPKQIAAYLNSELTLPEITTWVSDWVTAAESRDHESSLEGQLWNLGYGMLRLAGLIPVEHPFHAKLAALVASLRELGPIPSKKSTGGPMTVWGNVLWSDLPILGASVREKWNEPPEFPQYGTTPAQWASMNAFVATLTTNRVMNFQTYADWALADAFKRQAYVDGKALTLAETFDMYFPSSTAWLIIGGPWIHATIGHSTDFEEGPFWKISKKKKTNWEVWRDGFEHALEMEDCKPETKELARRALQEMERAEKNSKALEWPDNEYSRGQMKVLHVSGEDEN